MPDTPYVRYLAATLDSSTVSEPSPPTPRAATTDARPAPALNISLVKYNALFTTTTDMISFAMSLTSPHTSISCLLSHASEARLVRKNRTSSDDAMIVSTPDTLLITVLNELKVESVVLNVSRSFALQVSFRKTLRAPSTHSTQYLPRLLSTSDIVDVTVSTVSSTGVLLSVVVSAAFANISTIDYPPKQTA